MKIPSFSVWDFHIRLRKPLSELLLAVQISQESPGFWLCALIHNTEKVLKSCQEMAQISEAKTMSFAQEHYFV